MKILLDECVDRRLARDLVGHSVPTVPKMDWAGIKKLEDIRPLAVEPLEKLPRAVAGQLITIGA